MSKKVQTENEIVGENVQDKEKNVVKRNIKDCVFTDLFGNKKYLRELYLALHPEDTDVTEDDLTDITIENVLVNDLYNDLGFRVGDKLIILVEAQSTWSPNILIRSLLYVATTYQQYVLFTKVYDEQRKLYGRTQKTIEETIRISKERNVLKAYLESREKEVVTMMMTLFDHEKIMKNHDANIYREATERANEQAIINIITIYKQVNGSMDDAIKNVMTMYDYSEKDAIEIVQKYWNDVPVTINIQLSKED